MKKRILVVEDVASLRKYLSHMLIEHGYDAVGASNVAEACAILHVSPLPFNLILTDYYLPDGTGMDLLSEINNDPLRKNIPVVFLTREDNPVKVREATNAGLRAWILKPYRADNFFTQIRNIIRRSSDVEKLHP
jgi:two-component system, chemotaxis family, chemotaxis protein CheY